MNNERPSQEEDEGSDHEHDGVHHTSKRPQHQHVGRSDPHASPQHELTSILYPAAAKSERKSPRQTLQRQSSEESATKKALRRRASRYFHRGSGSSAAKVDAADRQQPADSNSDATSTVTRENNSLRRKQLAAAARSARPPVHNNVSNRSPPPSTTFFPRTAISPETPSNAPRAKQKVVISPGFPPKPASEADDPSLQTYPSDVDTEVQLNATSGYNSGSDLENAARRIMRGGRRYQRSPPRTTGREDATDESPETKASENNAKLKEEGAANNTGFSSSARPSPHRANALPKGWRERIERKTGKQLPRMDSRTSLTTKDDNAGQYEVGAAASEDSTQPDDYIGEVLQHDEVSRRRDDVPAHGDDAPENLQEGWRDNDEGVHYERLSSSNISSYVPEPLPPSATMASVDNQHGQMEHDLDPREQATMANADDERGGPSSSLRMTQSEYDGEYQLENLENNDAFPKYRTEGGRPRNSGGFGCPPTERASLSVASERHNEADGDIDEDADQSLKSTSYDYFIDKDGGMEENSDEPLPLTMAYGHQNKDDDAEAEYEVEELEQYFSNEEWDPDEWAEGEGDPRGDFAGFGPIARREEGVFGDNTGEQVGGNNGDKDYVAGYADDGFAPISVRDDGFSLSSDHPGDPSNHHGENEGESHNFVQNHQYVDEDHTAKMNNNAKGDDYHRDEVFLPLNLDGPTNHTQKKGDNNHGLPVSNLDTGQQSLPQRTKRVRFSSSVEGLSSSVEGDAGGDIDVYSDGFDEDEYIHQFYSKSSEEESNTINDGCNTCWDEMVPPTEEEESSKNNLEDYWEEIPSLPNVEWSSPSRKKTLASSPLVSPSVAETGFNLEIFVNNDEDDNGTFNSERDDFKVKTDFFKATNDNPDEENPAWSIPKSATTMAFRKSAEGQLETFASANNQDEDSAWSLPKSTTETTATVSTTVSPVMNPFVLKEDGDSKNEGVTSIPQWKLRKLMAEKQQRASSNVGQSNPGGQLTPQLRKFTTENESALINNVGQETCRVKPPEQAPEKSSPKAQYVFSEDEQLESISQSPLRQPSHTLSDGNFSDMGYATSDVEGSSRGRTKSRRGLRFFRSRNRKYNTEGERSDSDWESSADERSKPSFSLSRSPLRGKTKKITKGFKLKSKSPRRRRLFKERQCGKNASETDESGGDTDFTTRKEYLREGPKLSVASLNFNANETARASHVKSAQITKAEGKYEGQTVPELDANPVDINLNDSRETDIVSNKKIMVGNLNSRETRLTDIVSNKKGDVDTYLNDSRTPPPTSIASNTEDAVDTNLNDSRETQSTAIMSSATGAFDNNLNDSRWTQSTAVVSNARVGYSQMPSLLDVAPSTPSRSIGTSLQSSIERPGAIIEAAMSKDSGPSIRTGIFDEETISSLGSRTMSTLGSLVTKGTTGEARSAKKSHTKPSDTSTGTELSEIDRLRKENDRLREELENASQLSSRVSSIYAETLKLENNRLREELETTSKLTVDAIQCIQSKKDRMYKSTLETLLEKDNMKDTSKHRRHTAARQEALTDFDHLPPVAHLINGVDFDDDSITTYSPIGNDVRQVVFERAGRESPDLFKRTCSKIAVTTRTVADQVKTVARDLNNERRENGSMCIAPIARPLECFSACARRDRSSESMTYTTRKKSNSTRKEKKTHARRADQCGESSTTGSLSDSLEDLGRKLKQYETLAGGSGRRKGHNISIDRARGKPSKQMKAAGSNIITKVSETSAS